MAIHWYDGEGKAHTIEGPHERITVDLTAIARSFAPHLPEPKGCPECGLVDPEHKLMCRIGRDLMLGRTWSREQCDRCSGWTQVASDTGYCEECNES